MAITLDNRALVTIYGGSGFIGRHVDATSQLLRLDAPRPRDAG